jgi:mRNA interferase HigB
MRIIAVGTLKQFWEREAAAEQPLRAWIAVTKAARWPDPPSIKGTFNTADILKGGRVVFDIGGNKYRLVAWINYAYSVLYVRFIGTHKDYDQIDANEV